MNIEQRQEIENQIKNDFSELQNKLADLKNEVENEKDENKRQEKQAEYQKLLEDLEVIEQDMKNIESRNVEEVLALKTKLEEIKKAYKEYSGEVSDLQNVVRESADKNNEKIQTPTTYDLLKNSNSETYNRLLKIISENPDKFKDLKDDKGNKLETPDAKLEHIFNKIRENITILVGKKIGESEKAKDVIKNTIAPAFEWSLMETLRREGNESNVGMLEGIDKISWNNLNKLFDSVKGFSENYEKYFVDFRKWMNAVDYLSVNDWVLKDPNKSEVLSNPLKFQEYMNDSRFEDPKFSPYKIINGNIFKIDENGDFKYGITSDEQQQVLSKIGSIQVVNNPETTSLIVGLLDKSPGFLEATAGLQETGKHLLDFVDSINPVTKIFGIDIFKEIKSKETSLAFKALDFVCKLIGITGGLEGIIKKWRMDRMNLTDEKNDNIREILEEYKKSGTKNESLSIVDENSCKTALEKFAVTEQEPSTTTGDFLRDSIANNMNISLVSPVVIQQTLGEPYLQKQIIKENGITRETYVVDESKFDEKNKKDLAHKHLENMKAHLEKCNENDLSEFYTNISSTEDLASCIIASLYVDKNDVIEGVEAKVFLPENYGSVHLNGTVEADTSGEVSEYQLSSGKYPFKDVHPYKNIGAYDLRNVKMTPLLDYRDLVKGHEGSVTLNGENIINKGNEYPTNDTTGNKNNNPCDISHSDSDIGYQDSIEVADGQSLAKYDTPVHGIASAMRLLKNKYSNKSVTEINVGGYQGYYKPNEEIGLSALRIKWITDQCNALGIGPHQMLNLDDPTTLKSFVAQIAVLETGTHIGQQLLDEAYNLAFA